MAHLRLLDDSAYDYLIERNPNSWSKAFFEMDRRCAAFENGISESFNRAILLPRHKPIITMLEEIRIYIMQRLVAMNKLALNLEDTITPSIRKQLEILKVKQRDWLVYASGFQELKVRICDESYGVDLTNKVCGCRMWELSGVPCVHAMAGYMHRNKDPDNGCANQINKDPFIPLRIMKEDIKQKFMIDVSIGQCKRAKQTALYDHEGGLIDHHGKLREYRKALIDSNLDWLPQAEHKKCTRHLYANFKKRYSGVEFNRLFWGATTSTLVQQFE
ncbi:agenet domain-containing protein [Tanacetum coccineum]